MSPPLCFQLATGDKKGRSQSQKRGANDRSDRAHPERVAPNIQEDPGLAPITSYASGMGEQSDSFQSEREYPR